MQLKPFVLAIALSLSLCLPGAAWAMQQNRLIFVDGVTGHYLAGGIDQAGIYHAEAGGTAAFALAGITNLASVPGLVLAYNATAGGGTEIFESHGFVHFFAQPGFSASWQKLVTVGGLVFFYDGSHTAAAVQASADGDTRQAFSSTGLSPWTIIQGTDNYLFFYNRPNGSIVTASLDDNGFNQSQSSSTATGYTLIGSVGDNLLLFNRNSGQWESGSILYNGSAHNDHYARSIIDLTGSLGLGYSKAVQMNGHLMLYDSATGSTAIGHFQTNGTFVLDSRPLLPKFYTDLLNCGQYLAFYGYGTGKLQTGYIDKAGNYHAVQTQVLVTGHQVISTKN